jgi:hypothetical protein
MNPPRRRYRCRFCGAMLLQHLSWGYTQLFCRNYR